LSFTQLPDLDVKLHYRRRCCLIAVEFQRQGVRFHNTTNRNEAIKRCLA
jgi:hypothetical protein